MPDKLLELMGLTQSSRPDLVPGFFGALARAIVVSWRMILKGEGCLVVFRAACYFIGALAVGLMTAAYLTDITEPVMVKLLGTIGIAIEHPRTSAAFITGFAGIALLEGALKMAKAWSENPRLPLGKR
ncbi:hypothetical protein SAMN04515647_4362 [Cohaesibacter sp. ES.047]|uniref:hypothetical protein n=1 Tax=Cohaesibacter sp. ES.047 TaxID=1798205 RepID=UPI000BB6C091|nr:hypothetical protein [Cohaesibacter sp. ES.047]SNY94037.1 hypothetical protein SAMN04515647_4362 [Cohaesibacter sp. ES.047]